MQRIHSLLKKLGELSEQKELSIVDADLMLDYTRVLYADLLEFRKQVALSPQLRPALPHEAPEDLTPQPAVAEPTPIVTAAAIHAPLYSQQEMPSYDPAPSIPARDIRQLISVNDKYQFITELFQGNRSAYEKVIETLDKFETAMQAQNWLHARVFNQYNWDTESDTVQAFYDVINQFFSDK